MHAIELETQIDANGEIHIQLPGRHRAAHARVIVLIDSDNGSQPAGTQSEPVRQPSPRLANQGAVLRGDDVAPAFALDDWGALHQ
jgi:hypothetical protein